MEIMPVYISSDAKQSTLASAMMMLRAANAGLTSTTQIPLQSNLGFEHFVGVSNRHKSLMSQAKKLAMLDQPLLIEGNRHWLRDAR